MNTIFSVVLMDGEQVSMTLNFAALYKLRAVDRKAYDTYMETTRKEYPDEMDVAIQIYTAYRAANTDKECMKFEEFLEVVPVNREELGEVYMKLQPRKNSDSQKPSKK